MYAFPNRFQDRAKIIENYNGKNVYMHKRPNYNYTAGKMTLSNNSDRSYLPRN